MDKPNLEFSDVLEQRLKLAATRSRPAFSNDLHQRILAAVEESKIEPVRSYRQRFAGRKTMLLAASLLAVIASGWFASRLAFGPQNGSPDSPVFESNQWAYLDEDVMTAADWFVDELPLDLVAIDSPDESTVN